MFIVVIGRGRLALLGTISMVVLDAGIVICFAIDIYDSSFYSITIFIIRIIAFLEFMVNGISISPTFYSYAVEVLPERGFTLILLFHWICEAVANGCYYYFNYGDQRNFIVMLCLSIFFLICSSLVI